MEFDDLHLLMGMFHSKLFVSSSGSPKRPINTPCRSQSRKDPRQHHKKATFFDCRFNFFFYPLVCFSKKIPKRPSHGGVVPDRKIMKLNSGVSRKPCLIKVDLAENQGSYPSFKGLVLPGFLYTAPYFMGNLRFAVKIFP